MGTTLELTERNFMRKAAGKAEVKLFKEWERHVSKFFKERFGVKDKEVNLNFVITWKLKSKGKSGR